MHYTYSRFQIARLSVVIAFWVLIVAWLNVEVLRRGGYFAPSLPVSLYLVVPLTIGSVAMLFAGARRMKRFGVHVRDGFIEVVALGGSAAVSLSNADISFGSDAVELRSGLKRIQLKRNVYRQFDALKAELMRQSKASESQSDK